MKKKVMLSILLFISFIPMLFPYYGEIKGAQDISGLVNIFNPIGSWAIILFFMGVWGNLKNGKILSYIGMIGIIVVEIYNLLNWTYPNIRFGSYTENIKHCLSGAYPMAYVGIMASVLMVAVYKVLDEKVA